MRPTFWQTEVTDRIEQSRPALLSDDLLEPQHRTQAPVRVDIVQPCSDEFFRQQASVELQVVPDNRLIAYELSEGPSVPTKWTVVLNVLVIDVIDPAGIPSDASRVHQRVYRLVECSLVCNGNVQEAHRHDAVCVSRACEAGLDVLHPSVHPSRQGNGGCRQRRYGCPQPCVRVYAAQHRDDHKPREAGNTTRAPGTYASSPKPCPLSSLQPLHIRRVQERRHPRALRRRAVSHAPITGPVRAAPAVVGQTP